MSIPILKKLARQRRSKRGISTIMANLMMLIIVVTLSSMLFIWATANYSTYLSGAGYWYSSRSLANQERVSIENVFFSKTGTLNNGVTLYIRNVGATPFTIASVYINGTQYNIALPPVLVSQTLTVPITLTGQTWAKGDLQTVEVATLRGTLLTITTVS